MCDSQTKLIAWLDRELSAEEAAGVERHIEGCQECRSRLAAYEQASETFDLYCDAVVAKTRRRSPVWALALASAVAASVVIFLAFPRTHVEPPDLTPTITVAAASAASPVSTPPEVRPAQPAERKITHTRHSVAPAPIRAAKWQPPETTVQIAIPAEAMFPPGAMPNGLNFIAEMSIAPDGSVKQVRLRQ
jgi:anti-sigma factor RsiW